MSVIPEDDVLSWAESLPVPETRPKKKDPVDSTAAVLDEEFTALGYPGTARLSILGDVGRENNWDRNTIFKGHSDPKNQSYNRGIISWQDDRRTALDNFLKKEGVLGRNDDDELRGMARFMDKELREKFPDIHQKLLNPKSTYDASEALRRYIKYVPDAPYNSPDPEFRVKNNAEWAKRARKLGLGQELDLNAIWGDVDSVLTDPETVWNEVEAVVDDKPIVTPTVPGQKPLIAPGQPLVPDPNEAIQDDIDRSIYGGTDRITFPNVDELTKIGESAKEGKEYEDNYEVQTRFNLEQIKNPSLTVEEFNKKLKDEYDAESAVQATAAKEKWLASTSKAYREFAKSKNLDPYAEDTVNAYNQSQPKTRQVKARAGTPVTDSRISDADDAPSIPNTLKLKDGTTLSIDDVQSDAPEGKIRFKDADGETYFVDATTGQISDDSLNQIALESRVSLIPYDQRASITVPQAQERRAAQIAANVAEKYGIDANDAFQWILKKGFVDWQTKQPFTNERYYETLEGAQSRNRDNMARTGTSVGAPGAKTQFRQAEETDYMTRRDLRELSQFTNEAKNARRQDVLAYAEQGGEITDEVLAGARLTRKDFDDDLAMAEVKGRVNREQLERLIPQFQAKGYDSRESRILALKQMGLMRDRSGKDIADAELAAYKTIKDRAKASYANPVMDAAGLVDTGAYPGAGQARQREAESEVATLLKKYGSAQKALQAEDFQRAMEAANAQTVAEGGVVKQVTEAAKRIPQAFIRGIGDAVQGTAIYTKDVAEYLDKLLGTQSRDIKDHAFYTLGKSIKDLSTGIKTDRAYDTDWMSGVGQGLGSTFSFAPLAIGGPAAIALFSTAQMAGGAYEEALQDGATEGDVRKYAQLSGALLGWTEMLGFGRAFQRLLKGGEKAAVKSILLNALKESGEEVLLNEGPQALGQNYLARLTYDPTRKWDKGVFEQMRSAGIAAPLASTLISGLLHVKNRHAIARIVADDVKNGGPSLRNFGGNDVYVYGQRWNVPETEQELVDKHREIGDQIQANIRQGTKASPEIVKQTGDLILEQMQLAREIISKSGLKPKEVSEAVEHTQKVGKTDGTALDAAEDLIQRAQEENETKVLEQTSDEKVSAEEKKVNLPSNEKAPKTKAETPTGDLVSKEIPPADVESGVSDDVSGDTKAVSVGTELRGNKVPPVEEVEDLLRSDAESQGSTWVGEDGQFQTPEQARRFAQEVHDIFDSLPDKVPVYRAVSANEVDLDPYGIGESWSLDHDAAKEFGKRAGKNIKIISALVPKENIDFERSVRAYGSFSSIGDGDSEFEAYIEPNSRLDDVQVSDVKASVPRKEGTLFTKKPLASATDATTQDAVEPSPKKGETVSPIRSRTRELGLIRPKESKEIAPSKLESSASSDVSGEAKVEPKEPWQMTPEEWSALSSEDQDALHTDTGGANPSHSNYQRAADRKAERAAKKTIRTTENTVPVTKYRVLDGKGKERVTNMVDREDAERELKRFPNGRIESYEGVLAKEIAPSDVESGVRSEVSGGIRRVAGESDADFELRKRQVDWRRGQSDFIKEKAGGKGWYVAQRPLAKYGDDYRFTKKEYADVEAEYAAKNPYPTAETPTVEKDATTQEPLRAVPEDVKPKLLDFYQQAFTLPSIEGKNAEQRTILKHLKQKGNALQALVKCIHK